MHLINPHRLAGLLLACAGLLGAAEPGQAPPPPGEAAPAPEAPVTTVVLETDLGDITLALQIQRAPITAGNFLGHVDGKRYDGATIYRAVKIGEEGRYGLVQGGLAGSPHHPPPPIAHEAPAATGLRSVDGAVSMARNEPGSATSEFFFIVGDLPALDGSPEGDDPGYAVFGHVVDGMDLVRTILLLPRKEDAQNAAMAGQMLQMPVKIRTARRAD